MLAVLTSWPRRPWRSIGPGGHCLFLFMNSRATRSFWDAFNELSPEAQKQAVKQYRLWLASPRHPSVQFKKIGNKWSARVSDNYRALGVMDGDTVVWFWIGTHARYDQLLRG